MHRCGTFTCSWKRVEWMRNCSCEGRVQGINPKSLLSVNRTERRGVPTIVPQLQVLMPSVFEADAKGLQADSWKRGISDKHSSSGSTKSPSHCSTVYRGTSHVKCKKLFSRILWVTACWRQHHCTSSQRGPGNQLR